MYGNINYYTYITYIYPLTLHLVCNYAGAGYPNVGAISQYEFGENGRWQQLKELAEAHAVKIETHQAAVNAAKAAKKEFDEAETKQKPAAKAKHDKLQAVAKAAHQALKGGVLQLKWSGDIITY